MLEHRRLVQRARNTHILFIFEIHAWKQPLTFSQSERKVAFRIRARDASIDRSIDREKEIRMDTERDDGLVEKDREREESMVHGKMGGNNLSVPIADARHDAAIERHFQR